MEKPKHVAEVFKYTSILLSFKNVTLSSFIRIWTWSLALREGQNTHWGVGKLGTGNILTSERLQ
jgi:hypothetical protein